jgi:hypothetical protein
VPTYLNIGGLVAAGFNESGEYLLTVSHSGRGVFATGTWSRVARDGTVAYPIAGCVMGIGPIAGESVAVSEMNYQTEELSLSSPNGMFNLSYESGTVTITSIGG